MNRTSNNTGCSQDVIVISSDDDTEAAANTSRASKGCTVESQAAALSAGNRLQRNSTFPFDIAEVIEISDDDSTEELPAPLTTLNPSDCASVVSPIAPQTQVDGVEYPWDNIDDGSILVLNDPPSARRPVRRPPAKSGSPSTARRPPGSTARRIVQSLDSEESDSAPARKLSTRTPTNSRLPSKKLPRSAARRVILSSDSEDSSFHPPSTPLAATANITPQLQSPKTPRRGKKALAAVEQARRENYATRLFNDLNQTVFGEGLPTQTKLIWSKRLLTTAGRAKWHRSRHGVETSEIELATKILDSDERIRNTLSHEMCHLACWVINNNIREGHGKEFKAWAAKVMKIRPDIRISTRHTYEISYAYEWKCEKCDKIYGRHSKSIRPDECVCGACKEGRLIPLFTQRTPKGTKASKLAATTPQASPKSLSLSIKDGKDEISSRPMALTEVVCTNIVVPDEDAGIMELAATMGRVSIL